MVKDVTPELSELVDKAAAQQNLSEFESKLGIPHGFYAELLNEASDWGFLIKLSVILEAALTLAIVQELRSPKAADHVQRLSVQGKSGKLIFAKDLGILNESCLRRCETIFHVRNTFAHGLKRVSSTLQEFADEMTEEEYRLASNNLFELNTRSNSVKKKRQGNSKVVSQGELSSLDWGKFFRKALWAAGAFVLHHIAFLHKTQKTAQGTQEFLELYGEAMIHLLNGQHEKGKEKMDQAIELREQIYKENKHSPKRVQSAKKGDEYIVLKVN